MSVLRRLRDLLAVPPDPYLFDPRLEARVAELCRAAKGPVLNLGSGPTGYGPRVVNVDLFAFAGVHVRGDATRLPFRDGRFAGALLRGLLEHVRSAEAVASEVARVLAPGAFLYVEVPFLQPLHLSPEDHRRFTLPGLRHFLAGHGYEEVDSGVQVGPGSTLAWITREALASVFSGGSPWMYRKALAAVGWATFWLKYLDRLTAKAPHVATSASAVYFLGTRR